MRSGRLRKVGTLFLVSTVVSVIGAATVARAATCFNFTLTAVPAARTDGGTGVAPDSAVALQAKCLHDAFGNPVPNANLDFKVTAPGGSEVTVGSVLTDVNGDATFNVLDSNAALAPGGLDAYGSWAATAVYSVAVHADTTFAVNSGVATGSMTGSVPPGTLPAGSPLTLTADLIKDLNSKPVNNGTNVTFAVSGPNGFSKTIISPSTGVTTSADTASATANLTGADLQKSGSWSFTATAGGSSSPSIPVATTGAVPFTIVSGAVASLNAAVQPVAVTVTPTATFNVQANSAVDANANPANGQSVILRVTDPLAVDTDSPAQTIAALPVTGPGTGPGSGANYAFAASAANIPYGNYTAKAVAGTVSSLSIPFTIQPGLANAIGTVNLSTATVTAGTSLTVAVNDITSQGYAVKNGTSVKLERSSGGPFTQLGSNQLVSGVNKGDDSAGVTFLVPGSSNTIAGSYTLKVTVDGFSTTVPYTIIAGNPVADLTVVAGDTAQYAAGAVTVGNIPSTVATLEVTITKPNGGGTVLRSFTATAPTSNISIAAADLNAGLGIYALQVNGNDNASSLLAVGSGSLKVVSAVPDTIDVQVASAMILPTQSQAITGTATTGGQPVIGRALDITVTNSLGQIAYHTLRTTDALGKVSVSIFGAQTLAPGPYSVVIRDLNTNPVVSGTASFIV